MKKKQKVKHIMGFTLIELSIVLVVIALVVAGILIGQIMIRASEIRSAITQFEKYSSAVNTFRGKFNGLPGDIKNADGFGFDTGRNGQLSGNASIESGVGTSAMFQEEVSCFWDDLAFAGMIPDSLDQPTACPNAQSPTVLANVMPASDAGSGNFILIGSEGGINYFWLSGVESVVSGEYTLSDNLTADAANQIDTKIDDGIYNEGTVQAFTGTTAGEFYVTQDSPQAAAADVCIVSSGYNFITDEGYDKACQLRIRPQF